MTVNDFNGLLKRLLELDDFSWGRILLSRDPKFQKMSDDAVQGLVKAAMGYAEEIFQEYVVDSKMTPSTFAEKEGITIRMDDAPLMEEYLYFGHYFSNPPTIEVSQATLKKVNSSKTVLNLAMEDVDLREIIIAHEVFHHLEVKDGFRWKPMAKVMVPLFGKYQRPYQVRRFNEISAIHFSKLWLGVSYCPAIFDILLVHSVNPERARRLALEQLQRGGSNS